MVIVGFRASMGTEPGSSDNNTTGCSCLLKTTPYALRETEPGIIPDSLIPSSQVV
jgi:hypothetical protein